LGQKKDAFAYFAEETKNDDIYRNAKPKVYTGNMMGSEHQLSKDTVFWNEIGPEEFDEQAPMAKEFNFVEECQNCQCCHGNVYNCSGKICQFLGVCECLAHAAGEEQAQMDAY